MAFVLVDHDGSSSEAAGGNRDSVLDLPLSSVVGPGHYRPATAVAGARALRWLPLAAAASTVRAMLGASHEDLRLRGQQLSRALGAAFFDRDAAAARSPFGGARFPEDGLYVCAELPLLWPALQAVQRALLQVAVKGAGDGPCDWYYDNVDELMRLLVGDAEAGRGAAVFKRNKFEAAFAVEWAE
ncbi:unnamed protein product [Urochloa decumbens]|uniref:Uncharacterized protein n=1 Tax=Urochloa decumbens TaxID=240449 RepID=A0ABC9FGT4_9POAL